MCSRGEARRCRASAAAQGLLPGRPRTPASAGRRCPPPPAFTPAPTLEAATMPVGRPIITSLAKEGPAGRATDGWRGASDGTATAPSSALFFFFLRIGSGVGAGLMPGTAGAPAAARRASRGLPGGAADGLPLARDRARRAAGPLPRSTTSAPRRAHPTGTRWAASCPAPSPARADATLPLPRSTTSAPRRAHPTGTRWAASCPAPTGSPRSSAARC